jgi:hypothetical protein
VIARHATSILSVFTNFALQSAEQAAACTGAVLELLGTQENHMDAAERRPAGVTAVAIINAVAAILTFAFWLLVFTRLFLGHRFPDAAARAAAAATAGYLVADLVWALPLLAFSVAGLLRLRGWGWLLAQMVNILWLYSLTAVWVRDLFAGVISPGAVLFLPFALVAAWATFYLWRVRSRFAWSADQQTSA